MLRATIATALAVPTGLAAESGIAGALGAPSQGTQAPGSAAGAKVEAEDLGEPVHKTQNLSSAIGSDPDGRPMGYYFVEGNLTTKGEFAVVDLRSRETLLDVRIPSGAGSGRTLKVSPVDGAVYFGTADTGDLYRYRPGSTEVESLGVPLPDQRIWELAIGTDGTVWCGTYPDGKLFSYDPETGEVHDYGQALVGETYIEAIEQVGDAIYVGTEPNAKLARLDPATGTFTEIILPEGHDANNINELNLVGSLLFVSTDKLYVLDTDTGEFVDTRTDLSGRGVSPVDPDTGTSVYYRTAAGPVVRYDLATHTTEPLAWTPNGAPESWAWVDLADPEAPGLTLMFTFYDRGRTYGYHLASRKTYFLEPTLMGSGDQITTIASGPDGNIYCGAYLTPPGMGRWDPDKAAFELLTGSGQVEGFGTFKGDLVFGRYPQGALYRYDLDKPWASGTNPAPPVEIADEQNRPQSFVDLGDMLAVSSVPETGRHGGAVTLWNPDTNELQVFRNVVENQTPVSLIVRDGLIYGGTSINGGFGIDPVTPEGKVFVWDPVSHTTLHESVPVPGAANVSGLVFAEDDGLVWGLADATLFAFDPQTRSVTRTVPLFEEAGEDDDSRFGNNHVLLLDHGRLFGTTANRVFVVDRVTGEFQVLHDGTQGTAPVDSLALDRNGDLYFVALASHLYRYALSSDTTPPTLDAQVRPSRPMDGAPRHIKLSAQDDESGVAALHYRVDAGAWTRYSAPFAVTSGGEHLVEYRAVDRAFNASPVGTLRFTL